MIKSLELENFKAFGKRVKIPFAPITLLFGENSSGKSSILQLLNLLKQTRESREPGSILLPRMEKGISDLGSFQDLIFDHDLNNTLKIRIELEVESYAREDFFYRYLRTLKIESVSFELHIKRPSINEEIVLEKIEIYIEKENRKLAFASYIPYNKKLTKQLRKKLFLLRANRERRIPQNPLLMKLDFITDQEVIWTDAHKYFYNNKKQIVERLNRLLKEGKIKNDQEKLFDAEAEDDKFLKNRLLGEALSFYSSDFTISQFTERMIKYFESSIIALDGFVPLTSFFEQETQTAELYLLNEFPYSFEGQFDINRITILAGRIFELFLTLLFPLGAYRRPPERWYIFTGSSPKDVGYHGESLPDLLFRNPNLLESANNWLEHLDIGYRINVEPLGLKIRDLFEVKLIDTKRNLEVEIGLKDVGFGISQILPFIVQSLAASEKIISIEQPEVHIHPRLQADLGDLIAECIKKPYRNRFIIETHSEHLILRLQRLVRLKKISPSDLSVIFVSRTSKGSEIQRLRIDEFGDFIDEWPGGFFPERLRELRAGE